MRILCLAAAAWLAAAAPLAAQRAFPTDLALAPLAGEAAPGPIAFARAEGPTVVAFWATWCAPCKRELDAYAGQYDAWSRELGVEVYAVSVDQARVGPKVAETARAKGWPFPVLLDPEQTAMQRLGFAAIPQVFVVAPDGSIAYSHTGFEADDLAALEAELRRLAAAKG